jgi:predicted permease
MWRRKRALDGLHEDIRDHLEREIEENIARGMPPVEARRQALLKFGNVARVSEDTRAVWAWTWLEQVVQDVRYASRSLWAAPGFTAAIIVTLGLGIGVNTAMFSMLDAVVLQKLPVPNADELFALYENAPEVVPDNVGGRGRYLRFSYPRYLRLQQALGSHGSLAAVTVTNSFAGRLPSGQPAPIDAQLVSGNYFETLRVPAARGRVLTMADTIGPAGTMVAVVSDRFWKRALGGTDDALGKTFALNDVTLTVVGVAPPGFTGAWMDDSPDAWLPLTLQSAIQYRNNVSSYGQVDRAQAFLGQDRIAWLNLVGRVSRNERLLADTLLTNANRLGIEDFAIAATTNEAGRRAILAQTLAIEPLAHGFSGLRAERSRVLLALMGLVALVLLLTAANVANLLLVRAGRRSREIAVRTALGATTGRIVRSLFTETLLLAGLGGAVGVLAGGWTRGVLAREIVGSSRLLPAGFSLDLRTLLFAAVVSILTAIVFGLLPAVRAARRSRAVASGLNERQAIGLGAMKGMRPLVVLQLGLSVVIVFAATLLSRTLINLTRVDPGFTVEHLVTASFGVRNLGYSAGEVNALANRLVAAANEVPSVTSAAVSVCGLLGGCSYTTSVRIPHNENSIGVHQNWIGPGYLATVGLPLLRGREFDGRDTAAGPPVAIVTTSMAQRAFPGQDPIGKQVLNDGVPAEIVGVAGDVRPVSLREPPVSMVFYPLSRRRADAFPTALDLRVTGDPEQSVAMLRDALKRVAPDLTANVTSMPSRLVLHVARERAVAYLAGGFAVLALLLGSVGLYGVLSYIVAQRHREIGVRMALGARSSEVLTLVLKQGGVLAMVGLVLGLAAAPIATRSLEGMFFEVTPLDPTTFVSVAGVMLTVATIAAIIPARRATKVDPVIVLRAE